MNVVAFSTPRRPGWRWRIVNYEGEVVEESETTFPSIGSAVAEGALHLERRNAADRATRPSHSHYPRPYGRPR